MPRMFDFRCKAEDTVFERMVDSDTREIPCVNCGEPAVRIISPVTSVLNPHGGFPGAQMKWIKEHEAGGKKKRDNG